MKIFLWLLNFVVASAFVISKPSDVARAIAQIRAAHAHRSFNDSTAVNPAPVSQNTTSTALRQNAANSTSGSRSVMYFGNWVIYSQGFQPSDINTENLTHLLYAFAKINPTTGAVELSDTYADLEKHYPNDSWDDTGNNVYGCVKQLYLLKKQNRNMKTLLSIGGWTYRDLFAPATSTAAGRSTFASTAVQLVKDLGFDGIDIDWEYPHDATEAENFVSLLNETRAQLQNYSSYVPGNPQFLLSVASPANSLNFTQLDMMGMDQYLDMWNFMGYDYAGGWAQPSGHQANIYPSKDNPASTPFNTDEGISYYIKEGVSPSKINLGMPLYGHAFIGTTGPGATYTTQGTGEWPGGDGIWDYKVLPLNASQEFFDSDLIAAWSYDNATQTMISYDTPVSASAKANYVAQRQLGGMMFWQASEDAAPATGRSLLQVVTSRFGELGMPVENIQNVLDYPESQYDNLRNGMPS